MTEPVASTRREFRWPAWFEPVGPSFAVIVLVAANLVYRLVAYRPGYFWQDDYYITAWAKFNPNELASLSKQVQVPAVLILPAAFEQGDHLFDPIEVL